MQFGGEGFPVFERTEFVHNVAIIGNIVPVVVVGAFIAGTNPDRIHAELDEVRNFLFYSVQIADPVAVGIKKTARIYLVNYHVEKFIWCFVHSSLFLIKVSLV